VSSEQEVQAVIPTLGKSPWLPECLRSARREGGSALELVIVHQAGETPLPREAQELADRVLALPRPLGFAAAANHGIASGTAPWVLLLNDDAVLEPGWLAALLPHLEGDPLPASLQGVNLQGSDPSRADGCGIVWNRWWQAIQEGHGQAAPPPDTPPREIFGASATAVLLRRRALEEATRSSPSPRGGPGGPFDERLETYYEDVELAVRLRRRGWSALLVPAARARHLGAVSAPRRRRALLYGNRYAVVARLLGSAFWRYLPLLWLRDVLDLVRDPRCAPGILAGWGRALLLVPHYARRGAPAPDLMALRALAGRPRLPAGASER
jgi:GT2 family glycosyltransferase